jgi:hypothetical protein
MSQDPFQNDESFMAAFSTEELIYGINQYAEVKLQMPGDEFFSKVRAGESVAHLHHLAQEVADLVAIVDKRLAAQ